MSESKGWWQRAGERARKWLTSADDTRRAEPDVEGEGREVESLDAVSANIEKSRESRAPAKRDQIGQSRSAGSVRATRSAARERTDVILGLDIGTSSTKVVIQTPYLAGGRAVPTAIERGLSRKPGYLAPTALIQRADGSVDVPGLGEVDRDWSSLKVDLMENPTSFQARVRAAAFAAVIGRRAREWFTETQSDVSKQFDLNWKWNLGIPSNGYETSNPLEDAYRRVAAVAKDVAEGSDPIRLDEISARLSRTTDRDPDTDVIPEVISEAVGYARSHYRTSGLHILIDVGASTLDVCAFILDAQDGEDRYSILTSLVERRGMHELHRTRLARLKKLDQSKLNRSALAIDLSDPFSRIPDSVQSYFAGTKTGAVQQLTDERFVDECVTQVMRCMRHVRTGRYWSAPEWSSGIPVFLCGGGSTSGVYTESLRRTSDKCCRIWQDVAPMKVQEVPLPSQLDFGDCDVNLFSRLGVAYGLSFDRFDVGDVVPPDRIPDQDPRRKRGTEGYVSKDQV